MQGEFLPYADQFHADWTGFYANRPLLKRVIRSSESLLRATDLALTSALVLTLQSGTRTERRLDVYGCRTRLAAPCRSEHNQRRPGDRS